MVKCLLPFVVSRLTIDASTHLFWNMTHVKNLWKRNPHAKLIAVACEPTERYVARH